MVVPVRTGKSDKEETTVIHCISTRNVNDTFFLFFLTGNVNVLFFFKFHFCTQIQKDPKETNEPFTGTRHAMLGGGGGMCMCVCVCVCVCV